MKKIHRTAEIMWLLGIVFIAFGVAICSKADLGVSMIAAPPFILSGAFQNLVPWLTVGVATYLVQGVLVVLLCLVVRRIKWQYALAFLVGVLYGYTLDLFLWMITDFNPQGLVLRWVVLIVGTFVCGFGVACCFRTYLPAQVFEVFVTEFADKYKCSADRVKWIFDLSLLAFSGLLAWMTDCYQGVGLGTIVTTAVNAPFILFWGKIIDRYTVPGVMMPALESVLTTRKEA